MNSTPKPGVAPKQGANTPEKKFSTGAITATIWKNTGMGKFGPTEYRTISLQRRYKDRDGVWQSSNSLRVNDLPKAIVVLQKAYESLVIRENENDVPIEDVEDE